LWGTKKIQMDIKKNRKRLKLVSRILILSLLIWIVGSFQSCKKEENLCSSINNSYLEINGERFEIDKEKEGIIFTCEFNSDAEGFLISIDEFRHTIGGIVVDDFIGVLLKLEELKEGVYKLKRYEEYYCENEDFEILKIGEGITSIQTNNCCSFLNEEAEIEVFKCNGSFIIKGENINYSEYGCEVDQGGRFKANFQLVCN